MSLYTRIIDLQKLNIAWDRVRKNKPAAGVDRITFEQFDEVKQTELRKLQIELQNHTYSALPIRKVTIYKGEKVREIALYSMRDKVVQQSVATELNKMYDGRFCECTYAYRSDHSALNAVNYIESKIKGEQYTYALKVDISHYFDTINFKILKTMLRREIKEDDVIDLIEMNTRGDVLEDTGELMEKRNGIYQGSIISPILSNIYLMDFDNWLSERSEFFLRYSDDMIILGHSKELLFEILSEIKAKLCDLGLKINDQKSICLSLDDGIDFLGYHFTREGKSIPVNAEVGLEERLETMWLTSSEISFDEKIKKALEIIGGWEQYFRDEREISSIIEYTAITYAAMCDKEKISNMSSMRTKYKNIYNDIMIFLAGLWRQYGYYDLELLEYEQYYQVFGKNIEGQVQFDELLQYYRNDIIEDNVDNATEIMQLYTDMGAYDKAAIWLEIKNKRGDVKEIYDKISIHKDKQLDISINAETPKKYLKFFAGREDIHCREITNETRKRIMENQQCPLSTQLVLKHFEGNETLGTFIQRPNSTVHYLIVDIDISKKVLLQYERSTKEFEAYLEKAWYTACNVLAIYDRLGLKGYIEYSGYRGYHVWLFLSEWMQVRYANMFFDVLSYNLEHEDQDISIEYFPNKTKLKQGKPGQVIKLPYGMHSKTGERSYFIDLSGNPIANLNFFLDGIATYSVGAIKKILAVNTGNRDVSGNKTVDNDISEFGETSKNVKEVLSNCNLMRYLCKKSISTGYLTHFERLSVLYIFGHLGEEGKEFVHKVMSYTLNYQYNITERFIVKLPAKPISCVKLREQYKMVTAEYGCNCVFKMMNKCYPSPVLHAVSQSSDITENDITLPTSRTITKEKENKLIEEMNIHKHAQELAKIILERKKQKRSIDKEIVKIEKELEQLYDREGIDSLEIEMGLLIRRKIEKRYEWFIEI